MQSPTAASQLMRQASKGFQVHMPVSKPCMLQVNHGTHFIINTGHDPRGSQQSTSSSITEW
jgi:hypothetical protein